jgi:hypothetical protein
LLHTPKGVVRQFKFRAKICKKIRLLKPLNKKRRNFIANYGCDTACGGQGICNFLLSLFNFLEFGGQLKSTFLDLASHFPHLNTNIEFICLIAQNSQFKDRLILIYCFIGKVDCIFVCICGKWVVL